jgi:nicotinic acid mononucleotide adenylyltransferase
MEAFESVLRRMRSAEMPALELISPSPTASPRSLALLSGSFDPVTVGHVALAEAALGNVDSVVFVYSVRTLPKEGPSAVHPPLLEEVDRLGALVRVCEGHSGLAAAACSHGLLADQVDAAAVAFPGAEVSLVLGSDKLMQLFDPRWYGDRDAALETLLARVRVLYALREGDERALRTLLRSADAGPWLDRLRPLDVSPHVAAVSSSKVRALLRAGADISVLVPPEALPFVPRAGASP